MNNVQNTHINRQIRALHTALLDIVSLMNQPQRDDALTQAAGISLDRALFPLLIGIERFGPIGVVELAGRAGRDHTTISRQLARLESLGLVARHAGAADARVRMAVITPKGKAMTDRVDTARERMGQVIFSTWDAREVDDLVRLLQKFADAAKSEVETEAGPPAGG